jgi:hypothetical protein
MKKSTQNQKRTAIVYFGSQQEDYLKLVQAEDRRIEAVILSIFKLRCNNS